MNFHVRNENINVGKIEALAIGSSSMLKIGDTQSIQLFATFSAPLIGTYLGSSIISPGTMHHHIAGPAHHGPMTHGGHR